MDLDDGTPWYESTKRRERAGYEEPFDPVCSLGFTAATLTDRPVAMPSSLTQPVIVRLSSMGSSTLDRIQRTGEAALAKPSTVGLARGESLVSTRA